MFSLKVLIGVFAQMASGGKASSGRQATVFMKKKTRIETPPVIAKDNKTGV